MNDTEAESIKVVRDTLANGEGRLFDHLNATFRWLMATLFTANGGAILGLLGWSDASKHGGYAALGWFAVGLILSIVMGVFITIGALFDINPVINAKAKFDLSLLTRVTPNEKAFNELANSNRPTWKTWVPYYPGGASFLCLIGGMLVIAYHL